MMPVTREGRPDRLLARPPDPSAVFYNLRSLCLTDRPEDERTERGNDAWKQKLNNVRSLTHKYDVVCISEIHWSAAEAWQYFFRHLRNTFVFQEGGMAILVNADWAREAGIAQPEGDNNGANFFVVIPGVAHALRFGTGQGTGWIISFRLDAKSPTTRIGQLRAMTTWMELHGKQATVIFGGDRNFTESAWERNASTGTPAPCSDKMRRAWLDWLGSFGGQLVHQPEFTWKREFYSEGRVYWHHARLDVAGTNVQPHPAAEWLAISRRENAIPHPTASDHQPVALAWLPKRQGGARRRGAAPAGTLVRRTLPEWLFQDERFREELDAAVADWKESRSHGVLGLMEFADLTHEHGSSFLRERMVEAKTTQHRLDVTIAMLSYIERTGGEAAGAEEAAPEGNRAATDGGGDPTREAAGPAQLTRVDPDKI